MRMSSLNVTKDKIRDNHVSINLDVTNLGDTILHCDVDITKRVNEGENAKVQVYLCALLNSGGGILHLHNLTGNETHAKSLDTWWSGIEQHLKWLLSEDDICNYVDLVGDFNDQDFYVFVKTADHICTIRYHARVPTDTATLFLSYHTAVKLVTSQHGRVGLLSELPRHPAQFKYGEPIDGIGQETSQIQFKYLSCEKDPNHEPISDRISWFIRRYVSAFANHAGGHIFFGVEDKNCFVYGEDMPAKTQNDIVAKVEERMQRTIWMKEENKVERGIHWDVAFYPVDNLPSTITGPRFVVVVSIVSYPGLVYTQPPESYHIVGDKVEEMSFSEWRANILTQVTDIEELRFRYHRLDVHSPKSLPIYVLQDSIKTIQHKYFSISEDSVKICPNVDYLPTMASIAANHWIHEFIPQTTTMTGIALLLDSWVFSVLVTMTKPAGIVCNVLLLTTTGIFLLSLLEGAVTDAVREYTVHLGKSLKRKLVLHGGSQEKFHVICHVVNCSQSETTIIPEYKNSPLSQYQMTQHKLENILYSLVVVMTTYTPVVSESQLQDKKFLLTLSLRQFELLWQHQNSKELWVYGPAGAGKTLMAVQFIQKLLLQGCTQDQILYLCEHQALCDKIRSLNLCKTVCRRDLMVAHKSGNLETSPNGFYGNIRSIVIDEAQNFKDRDGDWYGLVKKVITKGNDGNGCHGYLWAFIDVGMQVHKFPTGIPDLTTKNKFHLTQVLRNSGEILGFASQFLSNREEFDSCELPVLQNSPAEKVKFLACPPGNFSDVLPQLVGEYSQHGYDVSDIAILFSKRKQVDANKELPVDAHVNTVKHFSGLERPVVIAVHPEINPSTADYNNFMLNLASRATSELVIISPSESELRQLQGVCNSTDKSKDDQQLP
ncbi:schlafen family member 5-like [Glandiceps talaboti]